MSNHDINSNPDAQVCPRRRLAHRQNLTRGFNSPVVQAVSTPATWIGVYTVECFSVDGHVTLPQLFLQCLLPSKTSFRHSTI